MRLKMIIRTIGLTTTICSCLFALCNESVAWDVKYDHVSQKKCYVNNPFWGINSGKKSSLKLPRAILHANEKQSNANSACQEVISIEKDLEIIMEGPLVIKASSGEAKGQKFELIGGCEGEGDGPDSDSYGTGDCKNYSGYSILNAIDIPVGHPCAVKIAAEAGAVSIRNIIIKGVPAGMKALCIESDYNEIDNVQIENVGGDAIVIEGDGQGNVISAATSLRGVDGRGIVIKNSDAMSMNYLDPFDGTVGVVDVNSGLELLTPPSTGTGRFAIETTGDGPEDWIVTGHPLQVRIIDKDYVPGAVPYIRIDGFVVEGTELDPKQLDQEKIEQEDLCDPEAHPAAKTARKIQIYEVGGLNSSSTTVDGRFADFIGKNIGAWGLNPTTGYFRVQLPADGYGSGMIFLVPERNGGTIGRPSHVIDLTDAAAGGDADIDCPDRPFNSTGFDDIVGVGGKKKMFGLQHCCDVRGIISLQCGNPTAQGGLADDYDTDGDEIPDDVEDSNWNCVWDANETKFYDVDTDGDGIIERSSGSQYNETTGVDTDGDGISNALDDDSDGDGLLDGEEDKNSHFVQGDGTSKLGGYLYRISSFQQSKQPIRDLNDPKSPPLGCTLGYEDKVGIKYEWYQVTCKDKGCMEYAANPELLGGWQSAAPVSGEGEGGNQQATTFKTIEQLICRNRSLGYWKNFNGEYNADNYETDPYNWDSDGDSWCDGDNSGGGCPVASSLGFDMCPTVNDPGNACVNIPQCYADEVFYAVAYEWVGWNSDGSPDGLKDEDNNNVPDLFEQETSGVLELREKIKQACPGDLDGDGIPDCVEQPFAICKTPGGATSNPSSWGLKYYSNDSDGDGFNDNVDVCPESFGAMDGFVEDRKHSDYSCEPTKGVYVNDPVKKVLASFLDRDGDGLWDAEEDRDLNGIGFDGFDNRGGKSITYDVLMTIETNPLKADSDGDKLSDYQEVSTSVSTNAEGLPVYTNPRNKNTDGDGLDDGDEDRNLDGKFSLSNKDMTGSEGCTGFMLLDTDPTDPDTDKDGLPDDVELDGGMSVGQGFIDKIADEEVWAKLGGIDMVSNPRSADSDNDGLKDSAEYNGIIKYSGSNPCMRDSDNDNIDDVDEPVGCRLNPDPNCVGGEGYTGMDSDSDGLSDICEMKYVNPADPLIHLDPKNQDTDGDGIKDGDEDRNKNCMYNPEINETNPFEQDTDGDGLKDGFELKYGTDPTNMDTDGDCLTDGMEDKNLNGQYDMGVETSALMTDTDNDGLPDGKTAATGLGEDFNCNGVRDMDGQGNWLETDPINPDSDNDGSNDGQEINGNMANIHRATTREGCMSIADAATEGPSSMFYLMGLLIMAVKVAARRTKKTSA